MLQMFQLPYNSGTKCFMILDVLLLPNTSVAPDDTTVHIHVYIFATVILFTSAVPGTPENIDKLVTDGALLVPDIKVKDFTFIPSALAVPHVLFYQMCQLRQIHLLSPRHDALVTHGLMVKYKLCMTFELQQ